jgi:hypothetical protein
VCEEVFEGEALHGLATEEGGEQGAAGGGEVGREVDLSLLDLLE